MKKNKKWLYIILIILLATPVIFLHVAFNGNPLSKYLATRHVKAYLTETYPDEELHIKESFYNFKDSGYNFKVIKVGEESDETYDFVVGGIFSMHVDSDGIYYDNLDEDLMQKLGKEASNEIKRLLQKHDINILEVDVGMEVLQGKHSDDIVWDKNFKPEKPMHVHIAFDAEGKTTTDVLEIAQTFQEKLSTERLEYSYVTLNGNCFDQKWNEWYVEYAISFEPDEILTIKDVRQEHK